MGVKIRPQEISVPEHDPFANDLLNWNETVEVLTRLVSAIEGPSVLAVDATWGNGKSTFIKIWAQYLRNKGFSSVEFNAWETDYSRDPFVALSSELMEGLARNSTDESLEKKLESIKNAGTEVLRRSAPALIRLATAGLLDISPFIEQGVGELLGTYAETRLAEYGETKEAVREFRCVLQDLAKSISCQSDGQPLVIFIDELDRCRPSYAIELLEVAKHLFAVDHVVFVLAVNHIELAHSIRAFYGSEFDATDYLRRFIDVDLQLPAPDRQAFVNAMLKNSMGDDISNDEMVRLLKGTQTYERRLLQAFFSVDNISLRRISQAIHRLGLALSLLPKENRVDILPMVTTLILRTISPELYYRFFRGDVSDLDVADTVFGSPQFNALRYSDDGVLFEAMLILATDESGIGEKRRVNSSEATLSPLMRRYEGWTSKPPEEADREHAHHVLNRVTDYRHAISDVHLRRGIGFTTAMELLELFSDKQSSGQSR